MCDPLAQKKAVHRLNLIRDKITVLLMVLKSTNVIRLHELTLTCRPRKVLEKLRQRYRTAGVATNAPCLGSPVVDIERMRPDHWVRSSVAFRAVTLLVG